MAPPTPLKSKKCSLCGKRKPLRAYLTTEKNNKQLHGNVCHTCLGIDGRLLNLHMFRKKIQRLLGKLGSGGLFKKDDEEDGGEGDGSWDPEDRGKSKEYRLNLDAEELGAKAKHHDKLSQEKKEDETKAQEKEHKQKKTGKEKAQKKQSDDLDEKTEKEEKLEQEPKDKETTKYKKTNDPKKTASTNQSGLFSSYLQKHSHAQRSYGQGEQSKAIRPQTSSTQESKKTTASSAPQQQNNSDQTSKQQSSNSTQVTDNKIGQQNATAFYKKNPSVADQFSDLSNVTIRNTVPTSVSAGTVRLFQQANMNTEKAGTTARQEAKQEGKEATAKSEANQLKKAMQLSMKSWK